MREREKDTLMLIKWRGVEKLIYRVSQTLTLECIFCGIYTKILMTHREE